MLDDAVRAHFVEHFVDSMDVQATVDAHRERLPIYRESQTALLREEMERVEKERADPVRRLARVDKDYGDGELSAASYERLSAKWGGELRSAEQRLENLRVKLDAVETSMSSVEYDAMLDRINSVMRIVQGTLTAEDVPLLNQQLCGLFDSFRVQVDEHQHVIVWAFLKDGLLPAQGATAMKLDFRDPEDRDSVSVLGHLPPPLLRKVDFDLSKVSDSS